ncbi:MAG: hypothetical protein SGJ17_05465 [Hyphomicrobiales bacterium]|nr:hypothetical protein [Hyphomicrobiales bacterium]
MVHCAAGRTTFVVGALCAILFSGMIGHAANPHGKDAQTLIFDAPYLEKLPEGKLIYSFEIKTSDKDSFGESFTDQAALNIMPSKSGAAGLRDISFDMFTGERGRTHGPMTDTKYNIVAALFLEWDLSRMKRFIKGEPAYFRNRVRLAFRDSTKVEEVKLTYEGREVTGYKLTIQPYLGDPRASSMEVFQSKIYEYTVSDAIPGGIYDIHIYVPNTAVSGPTQPFIDERMTFARFEKKAGAPK